MKKIGDTKGTFHAKMGIIKDRNVRDLKEDVQGYTELCKKCLNDPDNHDGALAPQLEKTHETPPSSRDVGLLFLHVLESNPGSSLQTEEEAGLP